MNQFIKSFIQGFLITLLVIILTTAGILAQSFNCLQHFDGIIVGDSIIYNPSENITNTKLTINKSTITIENNKYSFKLIKLISKSENELIYYSTDWEDLHCYIIIEILGLFKNIYFQYENVIYGYKIEEI